MHGKNQHWQGRLAQANGFQKIQAVRAVQRNIQNHNIRAKIGNRLQYAETSFGFSAYHQVRFAIDEQGQALTDDGMIIDKKYFRLAGIGLCLRFRGHGPHLYHIE